MSVPMPSTLPLAPMSAPSPPDDPPALRAVLKGLRVGPRYDVVSRCISDCGLVVLA